MKISKQTAALIREALIFGHLQGAMWAFHEGWEPGSKKYIKDSEVLERALSEVTMFRDIYPNLFKLTRGTNGT